MGVGTPAVTTTDCGEGVGELKTKLYVPGRICMPGGV